MTIRPDIQFGLNANRAFSDVFDRDEAIENIGLQLDDLEIIRGSAEEGVTSTDFRSASQLNVPLQRFVTKLRNDVVQYDGIVNEAAGTKEQLRGNLLVNGVVAASSIKYTYLEDGTNALQNADVSTSRVSSWSSPDSPPNDQSPIFYGGDLDVGGTITTSSLNLVDDVEPVRFKDSEIPTHGIETTINGTRVFFYAMKGIPLVFEGFFRNYDTTINLVTRGSVSIRIVNIDSPSLTQEFENLGGKDTLSANLIFRDTRSAQKNLEIYHNPSNIKTLSLNRIGMETLPSAELDQLQELRISRNLIREFPELAVFSPNLTLLDVSENPFGQADDSTVRQLNQKVTDRMPSTVTDLYIGNTFESSITGDLKTRFTDLKTFDCSSHTRGGSRPLFGPDNDDPSGALPEVADTVTVYRARGNRFETLPDSIKQLPDLEVFDIRNNRVTDRDFFIDSSVIRYVNTDGGNSTNVANMSGKQSLETYRSRRQYGRADNGADTDALVTPAGTYKFTNCTNLEDINLYASYYTGALPKFTGNPNLNRIDLYLTNVRGGLSDTEQDYCIYPGIFEDCASTLKLFRIRSSNLLDKPIHPEAFLNLENMTYLYVRSNNRGVSGSIPDLSGMPYLRKLYLLQNNLTGTMPNFVANPRLYYIHLYANQLSGTIPRLDQSSILYLYLHYNNFTEFNGLDTTRLRRLFIRNNSISGPIPDLSNLTRMYDCYMQNNLFDGYATGSFATLTRLRRLDISNNSDLTEGDVNTIIDDLYQNYQNNPRGRVRINLRNTATVTGEAVEKIQFLTDNGWVIRT